MNWRNCSSCITKEDSSDICNECSRCCILCKAYTVVWYIWFNKPWELISSPYPVKFTTINDYTAKCCTVTTDELSSWMDNDICTVFNRSYKVRCCKCVINNKWNVVCMCNLSNSFDINNFWIRISKCLNLNSLSIRLDCCFNSIIIKRIYECSFNSVIWKCMCKKVICSAVDILSSYDVVSCMSKCLESIS